MLGRPLGRGGTEPWTLHQGTREQRIQKAQSPRALSPQGEEQVRGPPSSSTQRHTFGGGGVADVGRGPVILSALLGAPAPPQGAPGLLLH